MGDAQHADESVQDEGGAGEQQVPADDEGPDRGCGQEQVGESVVDRVRHPVSSSILQYQGGQKNLLSRVCKSTKDFSCYCSLLKFSV